MPLTFEDEVVMVIGRVMAMKNTKGVWRAASRHREYIWELPNGGEQRAADANKKVIS